MDLNQIYQLFLENPQIVTDSRKPQKKSLFFALKGESFNGNLFADTALAGGCEYAIVDQKDVVKDKRYILVNSVLETLQDLAALHRQKLDLPIIGITGTNGKTTTKELVKAVLETKYKLGCTQGNFNNHIGVPLTLLSFTSETEMGVVEMGANHVGEIAQLCAIAQPNFGIITNVGSAHLEGFGSFEGVKQAKGELYEWLFENGGLTFVNTDNEHLLGMLHPQRTFTYGTSNMAECSGDLRTAQGFFLQASAILHIDDEKTVEMVELNTQLIGNYNFENVLAAAAIGTYFGIKAEEIKTAIANYTPDNNRSQLIKTNNNTILLDAYNANPTSMSAAIENLKQLSLENKAVILGDMFELGETADQEHQRIADLLQQNRIERAFLVGEKFTIVSSNFKTFLSTEKLIAFLQQEKISGCNILIKGSRGMGLERIVEHL